MDINAQEERIKKLDMIMNIAVVNLYTLGKEKKKVCFYNFNRKDKRHLACLHIADLERQLFGFEFKIKVGLWDYVLTRWKIKCKWLKRNSKPTEEYAMVDIGDFVAHIENANHMFGSFSEIYSNYFRGLDR